MMRSFYTGVSGLRGNQTSMDVISNNIANSTTTGYKSSSVHFQSLFSQGIGTDSQSPYQSQIGYGVQTAGITVDFTGGAIEYTGSEYNFAVDSGSGFFVIGKKAADYAPNVTDRNADGVIDVKDLIKDANLDGVVDATDFTYLSAGDKSDELVITATDLAAHSLDFNGDGSYTAADLAILNPANGASGSISINATDVANLAAYDPDSNPATLDGDLNSDGVIDIDDLILLATGDTSADSTLTVDDLKALAYDANSDGSIDNLDLTFLDASGDSSYDASDVVALDFNGDGVVSPLDFEAGISTTAYSEDASNINDRSELYYTRDGAFAVDAAGYLVTANGDYVLTEDTTTKKLKRIHADAYDSTKLSSILALAKFDNVNGLISDAGNYFVEDTNKTGIPQFGVSGDLDYGNVTQFVLESSNVDLAREFSDMIITSSAYDANAKSITTSDEMLDTLINIKR